ncbi:MAG TPA: DUF5908 family protein [Chitinophagaceae bacterium]|nr:DUF5908 family protein [Chitinophagaceae bacterium]
MAIELRELHIKTVVDAGGEKKPGGASAEAGPKAAEEGEGQSDQLISLCVEKVLEILKEKKER